MDCQASDNVKSSLVTHGFNDYTDAQKVLYMIVGINIANPETCIETITTNDALREDFGHAALHIMDFLVRSCPRLHLGQY